MDNTNVQHKLRIREGVMRFPVSHSLCVETNAGMGTMTAFWSSLCDRVVSFDTDSGKLKAIQWPNVETRCLTNKSEEARRVMLASEIVDVDPHGDPWGFIRDILRNGKTPQVFIAFTDGSWWERRWNTDARRNVRDKLLELPKGSQHCIEQVKRSGRMYYGWIYYRREP
ncbi:MAG: hypothetical protein IPM61_16600 [Chlorobi bacterium]|nr:hypothetical protein [Chlorobiota bacterium]